jgi:hypothetical protein
MKRSDIQDNVEDANARKAQSGSILPYLKLEESTEIWI